MARPVGSGGDLGETISDRAHRLDQVPVLAHLLADGADVNVADVAMQDLTPALSAHTAYSPPGNRSRGGAVARGPRVQATTWVGGENATRYPKTLNPRHPTLGRQQSTQHSYPVRAAGAAFASRALPFTRNSAASYPYQSPE